MSFSKEAGSDQSEIVRPEITILAEPPVALVDAIVDARGTRVVAQALLEWLYTDEAQDLIGRHGYRPRSAKVLAKHAATLPPVKRLFTVKDVAGSWAQAQKTFFAAGGVFDQLYEAAAAAK